jgi:HK97 family phage major capsid protein
MMTRLGSFRPRLDSRTAAHRADDAEMVAKMDQFERTKQFELRSDAGAYLNYALALGLAKGRKRDAAKLFETRWPSARKAAEIITRAAVPVGTTSDSTWAGPLAQLQPLSSALIETLRARTIVDRLPAMRRVPFDVKVPRVTAGAACQWIGEGRVVQVGSLALDQIIFKHSKVSGLLVITEELARLSDPAAERVIQNDLLASIAAFVDTAFLDPTRAEVTDVSPASITHNATEVVSSGNTAMAVENDLHELIDAVAAGSSMASPVFIMRPSTAMFFAGLKDTGIRTFPDITATGGTLLGVPVLTSANTPSDSNSPGDHLVALLDSSEVLFADDGITFDSSYQTSLQMDTEPESPPTASTTMVSLWQHNMLAIMATRFVRWARRRDDCCAFLRGLSTS